MGNHRVLKVTGGTQGSSDGHLITTGRPYTSGLHIVQPFALHRGSVSGISITPITLLPLDLSPTPAWGPPPHTPSATGRSLYTRCSPPSGALPSKNPWMSLPCGMRKPYFYSTDGRSELALHSQFKFSVSLTEAMFPKKCGLFVNRRNAWILWCLWNSLDGNPSVG